MPDEGDDGLDDVVLGALRQLEVELDALRPAVDDLCERAAAALSIVTWTENVEEQPAPARAVYSKLLSLREKINQALR